MLHVPTLALVAGLINLLQALAFAVVWRFNRQLPGIGLWFVSAVLNGLALPLYVMGAGRSAGLVTDTAFFHALLIRPLRLELLDRELFFNLREVNAATSNYAYEYSFKRPHGSLDQRPPALAAQRELPLRPTACAPVRAGVAPMSN